MEQKIGWIDKWIDRANQKEAALGGRLDEERRRRHAESAREQQELSELTARWSKL